MPPKKEGNPRERPFLPGIVAKVFDLLAAGRLFFLELRQNFAQQADGLLRRVEYLLILYLWISAGLLMATLGFFYLIIDFARVSRGVVFSIGGLLVFLASVILLQAAKIKKFKR